MNWCLQILVLSMYTSRLEHSVSWSPSQVLVVCKRVSWTGRLSHDTPAVKGDTHCWIFAEEPKAFGLHRLLSDDVFFQDVPYRATAARASIAVESYIYLFIAYLYDCQTNNKMFICTARCMDRHFLKHLLHVKSTICLSYLMTFVRVSGNINDI